MKKVMFGLIVFVVVGLLCTSSIQAYQLGVGALADRLGGGQKYELVGLSSPYAEIVVVDAGIDDKIVAVAEIEDHGRFEFGFNYLFEQEKKVEVFAVDELGLTSRVPLSDFLSSRVLMPPTIINDKADQGIRNLALKGMTHPNAEVEISLKVEQGGSEQVRIRADINGQWRLNKDDLKPGKYKASAISKYENLISRPSQDIFFEIALVEVPSSANRFWQDLWSSLRLDPSLLLIFLMPLLWLHINNWSGIGALMALIGPFWPLFGFKKRQKIGIVYDAVSKDGIENALVILKEFESKKIKAIDITNKYGEINFDLGEGEWVIEVIAGGYVFPSKLIKGKGNDGQYANIYHGEKFFSRRQDIVSLSVPLDPIEAYNQSWFFIKNFLRRYGSLVSWLWLAMCLVWSVILFVYYPDLIRSLILIYHLLVLAYLLIYIQPRKSGKSWVIEEDGGGVGDILVSIYTWPKIELVATRVTRDDGSYSAYLAKGEYLIKIFDKQYLLTKVVEAKDGIITQNQDSWMKIRVLVKSI